MPLFYPKSFWKDTHEHQLDDYILSREKLMAFGQRATYWRKEFLDRAKVAHKRRQKALMQAASAMIGSSIQIDSSSEANQLAGS